MSQDNNTLHFEQLMISNLVLLQAVEALIASHPNPGEVRRVFDQLNGQSHANLVARGEPLAAMAYMRALTEKLFSPSVGAPPPNEPG